MSFTAPALAVELSDGTLGYIVGSVSAFPRHPAPGTPLALLEVPALTFADQAELFAVVSVDWATEVTTVDIATATSTTEFDRSGLLGAPSERTWYLALVSVIDGAFALTAARFAAGFRTATLPAIPGLGDAPTEVRVHDHPLR